MRIYFSQYVVHADDSEPILSRKVYGSGLRSSIANFIQDLFPLFSLLLKRAAAEGCLCTFRNGDKNKLVPVRKVRFVITLKF